MIQVTKASGQLETLSLDKVRSSLNRAGANEEIIDKILLKLKPKLYDKISTREIYQEVFSSFPRYSLKSALMQLGPEGYRFEKFISQLFIAMGYQAQIQQIIMGECVSHEVDVVAQKNNLRILIECKFHNRPGTKTEIKEALYTQARFEDIKAAAPGKYEQIWLVTNTKLTTQAVQYGRCKNMVLLAWRYPENAGIEQLIAKFNLYHLLNLGYS